MSDALSLIGFLGFIACLIWLIVLAFKKQKKKNSLIGMAIAFVLFVIGIATMPPQTPVSTAPNTQTASSTVSSKASSVAPSSSSIVSSKSASSAQASKVQSSSSAAASSQKSIEDLRKSAKSISYKKLARYPDKYKDQSIKFSGKVIQSLEDSGTFTLRVAQDNNYDEIFLVSYIPTNDARILENDNITVYGAYSGVQSYTSTLGATITLPYVVSADIDIKS